MRTATRVKPRADGYQPGRPIRNERYLAFIRRLACCACSSTRNVEAAHTGPHGLGQKSSDLSAIPLCFRCHRADSDSLHAVGPAKFAADRGLDIGKLTGYYQELFVRSCTRRGVEG
jgi:hypothetical protein